MDQRSIDPWNIEAENGEQGPGSSRELFGKGDIVTPYNRQHRGFKTPEPENGTEQWVKLVLPRLLLC